MVFMIHIDKRRLGLDGVGRYKTTFDQLVRRLLEQITVFKRSRFMFAGIANEIVILHSMIEDLFPLDAGGKTCTSTPTEPGLLQFVDDIVGTQFFHTLLPGLVASDLPIGLDFPRSTFKLLKHSWFSRSRHAPFLVRLVRCVERYYKVPGPYTSR